MARASGESAPAGSAPAGSAPAGSRRAGIRWWPPRWRSLLGPALWFGVPALISLAMRAAIPPVPLFGTSHDDFLQVRIANRILDGQWLGPWDGLILSKGPGYPLVLAGTSAVGVPPVMLQQVLYLIGALLLSVALGRLWAGPWLTRAVFIVLALNPAMLGFSASRVYREGLVAGLALLAIGLAASVLAYRGDRRAEVWRLAGLLIGLGLVLGVLRIIRADTVWILVAVIGVLAVYPWAAGRDWAPRWWAAVAVVTVAGGACLLALLPERIVAGVNDARYGVPLAEDFTQGSLASAWRAWVRVEPHSDDPRAPLSAAQVAAGYSVSPTAARLAIDTDPAEADNSVTALTVPGSYAVWAMRDRAAIAGARSADQMQAFFADVTAELTAACADGRLTCSGTPIAAGMPIIQTWDVAGILRVARADVSEKWLAMAVAYPVAEVSERAPEYIGRLPGGTFPLDEGAEFTLWQRAVVGVQSPAGVLPPADAPVMRLQATLTSAYSLAWRIVWIPALIGLLLALVLPGRRVVAAVGVMLIAGMAVSVGILSAYSWHGGGWATYHYYLGSLPLALTVTVLGCFGAGSLIRQAVRRR